MPKVSQDCTPHRLVHTLRQPQIVEHLVEVPTIISFSSLQRTVEQNVGVPVVGGIGAGRGISGFLPGQSSSSVEQIADTPVPRRGIFGGSQGFYPGQSSTAVAEQIVDIPVPHGSRHLQDPGLALLPSEVAGEAFQGVFSTFPRRKKVRR